MGCSQIHERRNWERGRAVSFLERLVPNFRYSVFAQCISQLIRGYLIHRRRNRYSSSQCFFFTKSHGIGLQKCPVQSGNLLDVDLFVATEEDCLDKCTRVPTCLYYYFYTAPLRYTPIILKGTGS
jgi:hypothetical protein